MMGTNGQSGAQADPLTQAWRFATSLRTGIVLLALLAAASVVGVIMPQPESFRPNSYVSRRIDPQSPKALSAEELAALEDLAGVEDRQDRPPTRDEYLRIYYVDHYGRLGGWLLLRLSVHRLFHSWAAAGAVAEGIRHAGGEGAAMVRAPLHPCQPRALCRPR